VLPSVVQTVREALRLPYAAIALSQQDGLRLAAFAGEPVPEPHRLPLVYQGELLGELVLGRRVGEEGFSPADRRLLDDLVRQVGVAVHAMRLTVDLQRSRERLVTAREEERRRLRHDLHDGLGPALASMSLQLAAVRNLVADRPDAAEILTTLKSQMHDAVADIRRLVYALRPPVLDELGLVEAVREYSARLSHDGLEVRLEAPESLPPLSAAVEVAAYRIALEALANVGRHSGAHSCAARFSIADGELHLEVADDGRGLGPDARTGTGLISMRERAQELGGRCEIETSPDGGTTVRVRLPLGDTDD
jgi:signal transduction histidine kinase